MNDAIEIYRNDPSANQTLALTGRTRSGASDDRLDFNSLISTLRRRLSLFLVVTLGIFGLSVLLVSFATRLYTASAVVVIETGREVFAPNDSGQTYIDSSGTAVVDTEVQVLQSNELANKVAVAMKLDEASRYDPSSDRPGRRAQILAFITGQQLPMSQRRFDAQAQREFVISQLKKGLEVRRSGETYALEIDYTSGDPDFSAAVANEYARQYINQAVERRQKANENAIAFLQKRLPELREAANKATADVQQYRIRNNLLSANASQLTEQELSVYNQNVASARAAAAQDEARLTTARRQLATGSRGDDVGEALQSGVVSSLRTQRATAGSEFAELNARYGPRHPDVIKAQQRIADLDKSIQAEINRVISNLEAKTRVSSAQLASIESSRGGARGTLAASNRALVGFEQLTRAAEAAQLGYQSYLDRYTQAMAQLGTEQPNARIITWAQVPGAPSSPNVPLNLFLAAILGLGAGLAAAFIVELSFRGMTTGDEVEQRLGVPYLGSVLTMRSVVKFKGTPLDSLVDHPRSAFAEGFRSLQTSIEYSIDAVAGVVAITSALPREGKSTIAAGLARIAALDGGRVLLIDCDLRRRSINNLIAEPRAAGLIEVLSGEAKVKDALVLDTPSGAWLLPINHGPIQNSDPFSGEPMRKLLNELRGEFSYIVLDCPPLLPIADARVLATLADATVLVARWRRTSDHAVASALRLLSPSRTNLAGVVLTQVHARKQARFGYGDSTYYYNNYKGYFA